jgi:hypothetical protein
MYVPKIGTDDVPFGRLSTNSSSNTKNAINILIPEKSKNGKRFGHCHSVDFE